MVLSEQTYMSYMVLSEITPITASLGQLSDRTVQLYFRDFTFSTAEGFDHFVFLFSFDFW